MDNKQAKTKGETPDSISIEMEKLRSEIAQQAATIFYLQHELDKLKRMIFGQKRERFLADQPCQPTLFDLPEPLSAKTETVEVSYVRTKTAEEPKRGQFRALLPAHLPRVKQVVEPEIDTTKARKIGEEITEILEYTPGSLFVRQIIRPKYVLLDEQVIAIAEMPSLPIPKGNAGPSLLAYLLISKFVDHLPFYRIVQMLKRQNLTIAETTVSGWFMASCRLLWPLYQVLRTKVQQSNYIMADETTIAVLESLKKGSTHKGYHWVYYSPPTKLVCFDYQKGRAGKYPGDFLVNFKGTLQSDGYAGYDQFDHRQDIVRLSCMAHARRYFDEALKNDPVLAKYALSEIQKLYLIEQQALQSGLDPAQRHALREDKAVPVLDNFEIWLKKNLVDTLPKSAIHKAIVYALARWKQLRRYTENGLWEIDNNWVENTIRPVALGRKNYLFAGSHEAAEFAAMVYSFAASCKKNEVEPLAWFTGVLTVISEHKANRLEELLPGYVKPN